MVNSLQFILTSFVFIFYEALLVMAAAKILKIETTYKKALQISLILVIVDAIIVYSVSFLSSSVIKVLSLPIEWIGIQLLLTWFLIKKTYNVETKKAFYTALIYFALWIASAWLVIIALGIIYSITGLA